jgi:hypothetical protein
LQYALNDTTRVAALVALDETDSTMVRFDTDVDPPSPCSRATLRAAIRSDRVVHLLKRCKIKTLACQGNSEEIEVK